MFNNCLLRCATGAAVLLLAAVAVATAATPQVQTTAPVQVTYGTVKVDGLNIAYREAGSPASPKLVLLHGFPASSHQYRDLIRVLGDRFHVIAPDYPGADLVDRQMGNNGYIHRITGRIHR